MCCMIPPAVADYLARHRIGAKLAGRAPWSERAKEFRLDGAPGPAPQSTAWIISTPSPRKNYKNNWYRRREGWG